MSYEIIKEVCRMETAVYCIVRTNCYGSSMEFFTDLAKVAKTDFPDVQDKDIEVKHYAGNSYKHTFGLEFRVPLDTEVPEGYRTIRNTEMTL